MAAFHICRVIFYINILASSVVPGHIPMRYFNWAEPDMPDFVTYDSISAKASKEGSAQRLKAVRDVMKENGVDAYIIPTADAHNSQYIAPTDARREWLSGLQGSSGTVVVTAEEARVWTDSRYFTQFELQVNTEHFTLMRQGIDESIQSWLVGNLQDSVVGIDPTTYTRNSWTSLETALATVNISLKATPQNLVDIARADIGDPAPVRPNNDLLALNISFTGRPSNEKISQLLREMASRNATALVLTALDDIAYTLNIRGSDIPYNPVFFSYLVIRSDLSSPANIVFFWGNGELTADIQAHLSSEGTQLTPRPYENIFSYLENMVIEMPGDTVWLSQDGSHALYLAVETDGVASILSTLSPVASIKCVKNDVELAGFRTAHIKDGIAVVRGLRWVEESVAAGEVVTEIDLSDKLAQLRSEELYSHGPSFSTIAGAGENGAIIHYSPPREGSRVIGKYDMLLVDSGGQYKDGTTDITRTRHMNASPTQAQRLAFTRVLKGQIMLGTVVFPKWTVGHTLESFARKSLWDVGLNYAHGTGHGVGHFLNVHEGPSGILSGPLASDPGIQPKMIFSNEPGYYEVGEYGIRHEDLVEVIELNKDSDHILANGLVGNFSGAGALGFRYLSLVPHQTACLDVGLLSEFEIKFINDYHARVFSALGPILRERNLMDDYRWLEKECAPIRNAAIFVKSSPFLFISIVSLWFV
ncbi:unnamed protein product [Chilo suppressalis]|uniref:Peptidase M24 domain-containing protein n=1 Tax=Chilo suppressalis TaxID=168631 RepID=A0ABN8B9Q7_CHISP|nr:unnamed protein product [Chilo suppressalis]